MKRSLLSNCIDDENTTLYLIGEVNEGMYEKVVLALTLFQDREEMTIVLNTLGGDFYQSLAIYDMLRFSEKKVKIVCSGPVMSAGVIILQAATTRVAYENTQIMIHYGEDSNDSGAVAKHNQKMFKLMKKIISERVTVTNRTLNKWFNQDTYFNAREAEQNGLIDRIAGEQNG